MDGSKKPDFNGQVPTRKSPTHALRVPVKPRCIVSVEHPYIVHDVDKGIASLGGQAKLDNLITKSTSAQASLYQRPGIRTTKALHSTNVKTSNILLKVTVPRRTGLKRRRGSSELYRGDFEKQESTSSLKPSHTKREPLLKDVRDLLRSMQDNPKAYSIEMIGDINRTHRFRGMPDFVLSTANAPFMQKMQDHILPFDYQKMKGFKFDMSRGIKPNSEIIPPPSWSHEQYPFNYSYHQNTAIKHVIDESGNIVTTNTQGPRKVYSYSVPFDIDVVPQGPAPEVAPIGQLSVLMQSLIAEARKLIEERPIYTRRALQNDLGDLWDRVGENSGKSMYQYVGYIWQSGPWRDALVKFGIDPRRDPKYRIYQTLMFMLDKPTQDNRSKIQKIKWERTKRPAAVTDREKRSKNHIFDGTSVSVDGKVWQVCDIKDPLIDGILTTNNIRSECEIEKDGWYFNGTWARAKILMKAKMERLLKGEQPNDELYARLARDLPDILHKKDTIAAEKGTVSKEESHLRALIRATAIMYKPSLLDSEERADQRQYVGDGDDDDDIDPDLGRPESVMEGVEVQMNDTLEVKSSYGPRSDRVETNNLLSTRRN